MQTAGLRDGASHCAKILSSMYDSLNSDPNDPDVLVKLDIKNAFNMLCRQLTLDVLGGKASCDYACGLKEGDSFETACEELRNMFAYFKAMHLASDLLHIQRFTAEGYEGLGVPLGTDAFVQNFVKDKCQVPNSRPAWI